MLAGNFFTIKTLQNKDGIINAQLDINAGHAIFEGHFPGQPVVPGVCMLQMIKEVLATVLNKSIRVATADNLKFLMVINPLETIAIKSDIKYSIDEAGKIKMSASLFNEGVVYFKMSGIFIAE